MCVLVHARVHGPSTVTLTTSPTKAFYLKWLIINKGWEGEPAFSDHDPLPHNKANLIYMGDIACKLGFQLRISSVSCHRVITR